MLMFFYDVYAEHLTCIVEEKDGCLQSNDNTDHPAPLRRDSVGGQT